MVSAPVTVPLSVGIATTLLCGPCSAEFTLAASAVASGVAGGATAKFVEHKPTGEAIIQGAIDGAGEAGNHIVLDIGRKQIAKLVAGMEAGNASRAYKIGIMVGKKPRYAHR